MTRSDGLPSTARPRPIGLAAAILVLGGVYGFSQLAWGDFVITGSLPMKAPIAGVAVILYGASVVLGCLAWLGRGWLPAISLAAAFALLYLVTLARPVNLGLGFAHVGVVMVLVAHRRWFARVSPG